MTADLNARLGTTIRQRRVLLGLSQEALAKRVGVAFQQIQKYERGKNQVTFPRLVEIATALDTTATDLVAEAMGESAPTGGSDRKTLELQKRLALLSPNQREGVQLLVRKLAEGV